MFMVLRVLVVGGGLMGAAAAWRLSVRGHQVTVLERFGPGHDRGSSYGTSRIFRLAYAEPSYTDLALRALPLWRRLTEIRRAGGGVTVVTDADEALTADAVVVAVGGWAPGFLPAVVTGLPPMRVTQEQPVHFPVPDALDWPSFIHHPGAGLQVPGGLYGLGSVDGVKVGLHGVGPVVDPDHRDRTPDPAAVDLLRAYAQEWLPGVTGTEPTSLTCLYTTTPDEDFVVDRQGPVTVLAGFSGHGFKFGPAIGELAADLVEGRPGIARFALGRAAPAR